MEKHIILRRILYRIIMDRLAIEGAKLDDHKTIQMLRDVETDIYSIA